ncbi:MAG TPA: hypothetical protein VME23_14930 [Terracidiphilus sp.]|nr:hypothetical protein [Terracidiphilus sp.]
MRGEQADQAMIVDLLNQLDPDPDALLREISKHIDDEMLERISTADYGADADEHMTALRQVRDTGTFPVEMYWCPMEVLELIRWSEPEDPEWKPGQTGEFGHWMRAFSCAALLRATRDPWNYGDGIGTDSTLIQLVLSLGALPIDFTAQAVKSLAWLLLHSNPDGQDDQVLVYGVGLLWFALNLTPPFHDGALTELSEWIARRADKLIWWASSSDDCSGLREMVRDCQKLSGWEILACKFRDLDLSSRSSDLQVWVKLIGEQLAG